MKLNRRDFLTMGGVLGAGYLLNDALHLSQKIAEGVISNAYAQQLGVKRVLSLFATNAPPNWMFNLCLYPDGEFLPAANRIEGVGTGFDAAGKTVFSQQKRGDYYFPKMWFTPIPTSSGVWVSPETLLDNMLTIRGIWNGSDGHPVNVRTSFKALGANSSIHGMVADATASTYPISGVVAGSTVLAKEFSSPNGANPINSSSPSEAVTSIKDAFKEQVSLFRGNALDALVKDALNKMEAHSEFKKSNSNFNRRKADELIRTNLANIVSSFNAKQTKYANLIKQACKYDPADSRTHLPDLFDIPLVNYASGEWNPNTAGNIDRAFKTGEDLRDLFKTPMEINEMAAGFAMAEVLFENNLNANIISNLSFMKVTSPLQLRANGSLSTNTFWSHDDGHRIGLSVQTLMWSLYFRGFITCLYEFISVLKSKSMFNDTLITFSGDFARSPYSGSSAESRSDHGWRANAVSMWSGDINTPTIIGNTMLDASSVEGAGYKNLWGVGRVSPTLGTYAGLGNVQSTMATIIGVPSNSSNSKSLVEKSANTFVPFTVPKTT